MGGAMASRSDSDFDKLYVRALEIEEGRANGLAIPIFFHLTLRRHVPSMLRLASYRAFERGRSWGKPAIAHSPIGLCYRAYRRGEVALAAQNLAMDYFNCRDLARYRHWLRRAANAGDRDSAIQLRHFETRLPHATARDIGRQRPYRRYD